MTGVQTCALPISYDDKAFYQSLAEQFGNGRKLSDKQVAALKKLAEKYQK